MNNKSLSFIGEQVKINANWHLNIDERMLGNNVKRIMNDISNDKMIDSEYYYLSHPKVLKVMMERINESMIRAHIIADALFNSIFPSSSIGVSIMNTNQYNYLMGKRGEIYNENVTIATNYKIFYNCLQIIQQNGDPIQAFTCIRGTKIKY